MPITPGELKRRLHKNDCSIKIGDSIPNGMVELNGLYYGVPQGNKSHIEDNDVGSDDVCFFNGFPVETPEARFYYNPEQEKE